MSYNDTEKICVDSPGTVSLRQPSTVAYSIHQSTAAWDPSTPHFAIISTIKHQPYIASARLSSVELFLVTMVSQSSVPVHVSAIVHPSSVAQGTSFPIC
jgi:hypothetical protein